MRTIPPIIYSERSIQKALANWAIQKGHSHVIPNCGVLGWEADLISVTKGLFLHEYEIKISKSDFRQDTKKRKHKYLTGKRVLTYYGNQVPIPAHFWYVCPRELAKEIETEIPNYCGLLTLIDCRDKYENLTHIIQVVKKAPRLHDIQASGNQLDYISRGLMLRYWGRKEEL